MNILQIRILDMLQKQITKQLHKNLNMNLKWMQFLNFY